MNEQRFWITQGKGFQMKFDNGYMVSVQWGSMNYCDNRTFGTDIVPPDGEAARGAMGSNTAEVAIINPSKQYVGFKVTARGIRRSNNPSYRVGSYMDANEVARVIAWVARIK